MTLDLYKLSNTANQTKTDVPFENISYNPGECGDSTGCIITGDYAGVANIIAIPHDAARDEDGNPYDVADEDGDTVALTRYSAEAPGVGYMAQVTDEGEQVDTPDYGESYRAYSQRV